MAEIRVPTLGESVTEATIGKWFKKPGDPVAVDEPLVELETDKVTVEVPSPAAGVLSDVAVKDGDTVAVGELLGQIKEGAGAAATGRPDASSRPRRRPMQGPRTQAESCRGQARRARPKSPPAANDAPTPPSVRKLAAESGINHRRSPDGRWPRHQGRHDRGIEPAAAAPTPVAQPAAAVQVRAPSPATMPRARSACA